MISTNDDLAERKQETMGDSSNSAGDGASSARLTALLRRGNVRNDASTVLYMSAEWTTPLDSILVPFIQQKLSPNETLVVLRRGEHAAFESVGALCISCDQREFRDVCRDLEITRVPMVAAVINDFGSREQLSDSGSPIQQLMEAMRLSPNAHKWTVPVERIYPRLDTDSPALVALREEASARFEQGDFVDGAIGFIRALAHCPTCPKANFNMAVILQMMDEMYFAVDHMLRVVTENDQDAVAHTVLRTVLHPAEPELVVRGYESIVANHKDHVRAAHSLATIRGDATTAAPAYVRQVFDHLAETFEDKLVNHLEYRVPWQIIDALQHVNALPVSRDQEPFTAVDLGCGTGLCGRLLRPLVSHIAGMDLSPLMIEKTRESGFYDHAETGDIIPFLSSKATDSLDLVISADVWIYVGDLEEIFPLVAQKLRPRRWFAFSTELLAADDGFQLASSGRFQHSDRYISSLATQHGFTISVQEEIVVRKESGEPIAGRVFVLQLQP